MNFGTATAKCDIPLPEAHEVLILTELHILLLEA
jgi:hypothetical protein